MLHFRPPLLTRLRRHHGAVVLCVFVLLFKLVTGAVCLADAPFASVIVDAQVTSADSTQSERGDACLLGEAGDCHCACAHAAPLSSVDISDWTALAAVFEHVAVSSSFVPAPPGSLLRPPIA